MTSVSTAFLLRQDIAQAWSVEDTPYPTKEKLLPLAPSVEDVSRLIDAASTPYQRTPLMIVCSADACRAEITNLQSRY